MGTKRGKVKSVRAGEPTLSRTGAAASEATGFPIVGIGASAGGLEAFQKFFGAMPENSGAAFVLVQHLDPTRESLTAELVGTHTPMRVVQVTDGMKAEVNHVYVIPPNTYLTIRDGTLRLGSPTAPRSLRMAIDHFLRSLAADQRERAIGVVLSGTGTDGTLGLKDIKATGGMTMVQDPHTAQHDGMPRSAIAGGHADYVVPAEQMADTLLAYIQHAPLTSVDTETLPDGASDALSSVVALLRASTKFDFVGYRKGTLCRRIQRRMALKHISQMAAYVELLRSDPAELGALFKDLLLKVTSFFRDPEAWRFLQERVLRELVAAKREEDDVVRVWVPACATGEEAYSVAMALIEELQAIKASCRLQVFASDVDVEALDAARAGMYPESIAADVSPERLRRFFTKHENSYQVNKELRDIVVFAKQNLVGDPPFSKLDVISCRNLLIYLEPELQERLIALLHFALADGGCLFLGSAEGIGRLEDSFQVLSKKWRIYRRVGPTRNDRIRFPIVSAPVTHETPQTTLARPSVERVQVLAPRVLLERYAPVCVIIDRSCEILYFHGQTDGYLVQPPGPPTRNLIAQARTGLRAKLSGAVHASLRSGERVVTAGVRVHRSSAYPRVTIRVEPLDASSHTQGLWLVSFEDEVETATSAANASGVRDEGRLADADLLSQLEYELKTTKEDLQSTVEDFRASNEELMSVNEELQSSNEELETSKEELQSLNEELTTSNSQLGSKILELEAANNDLDNLLTSTSIATVFLDSHFCIRRFTPAATRLFSLIPSDIGRPIADIAQKFADPDLLSDAAAVLARPITPKREVQAEDGRWYVRQVLPYRTPQGRTEGVVITLSDVAAEALQEARLYAESIVETVREPLLVLDPDMRVCSANRAFYSTFQVSEQETIGRGLYELGDHVWDIPELRTLLAGVLPQKCVMRDFEVTHEFRSLGTRVMVLNASAIVRGGERPDLILLAIEDITERRKIEEALRLTEVSTRAEEQMRQRQAQLAHALRISTAGELASGLAHELNQPLFAIANDVEACARYVRSGELDRQKLLGLLDDASTEALRAAEIVEHLRHFIQKGEPQFEKTDLREIVRHLPLLMRHELEKSRISLRLESGRESLVVRADRIQIEQVIVNLIQNAIDAIPVGNGGKEITLTARGVKGMAEITVRDEGAGVSPTAEGRLFDPFFTTKSHGLGMGLAISRSIVEAHGGKIWVEPRGEGIGTTVRFTLPLLASRPRGKRHSK